MQRLSIAALAGLVLALCLIAPALAQQYLCSASAANAASVEFHCVLIAPTAAPTVTPTASTTLAPIETPTARPTGTTAPSTAFTRTVHAPLYAAAVQGDPLLDANRWAVVWGGNVGTDSNYFDARIVGASDGVRVQVQVIDRYVQSGDAVTVKINGESFVAAWPTASGWDIGQRCEGDDCRGWTAGRLVAWGEVGGQPTEGASWPFSVMITDTDAQTVTTAVWQGALVWGLPAGGENVDGAQIVTATLSADATLGGNTDCGQADYPTYFPTWGKRNWAASPYANVQLQWDIADWPCFGKYYAAWPLPSLPDGAQVVSATLTMFQFGNPGYAIGQTGETVVQAFDVQGQWREDEITWDNAPVPLTNVAATTVRPLPASCVIPGFYCNPAIPYAFDVTQIVQRAYADGEGQASAALYTAAGQYHSGKYFWRRIGAHAPIVAIAYVTPVQRPKATATPTATPTNTPTVSSGEVWVEVSAGAISTAVANKMLDLMFRNQAYARPNTYIALTTATISDTSTGSTITEPSGNAYARTVVNVNGGASPAWTLASGGSVGNGAAVTFPTPSGSWGTIVAMAICSASTGGDVLFYDNGVTDQAVAASDTVQFAASAITLSLT